MSPQPIHQMATSYRPHRYHKDHHEQISSPLPVPHLHLAVALPDLGHTSEVVAPLQADRGLRRFLRSRFGARADTDEGSATRQVGAEWRRLKPRRGRPRQPWYRASAARLGKRLTLSAQGSGGEDRWTLGGVLALLLVVAALFVVFGWLVGPFDFLTFLDAGRRVLFTRCSDLVQRLQAARRDLRMPNELAKLDRFDLLILDDLSYVRRDQAETSVLFELIAERYERKSIAITANTPFSQWGDVFVDPAMTIAAIDRLVHHATIFEMNAESYRRRSAQEKQMRQPPGKK